MTPLVAWSVQTLAASTGLMVLVLIVRAPVRRAIGPRLAYALWALPVVRMILPSVPVEHGSMLPLAGAATERMLIHAVGAPSAPGLLDPPALESAGVIALWIWAAGAVTLFAILSVRHFRFCARLRVGSVALGTVSAVQVIAADVDGPVAFGILRRFVAVPRDFEGIYDAREQELALTHECAHHKRGDLLANWIALVMLSAHWWNPIAWLAIGAFRDDQEFAADVDVLAAAQPAELPRYAALLAKAAGVGAPPACNLNARSSLKGRLMMLDQKPRSLRRLVFAGTLIFLLGGSAVAATALEPVESGRDGGKQAVTIAVKPDGSGGYSLIVDGISVASGAALPHGLTLPADFSHGGDCNLGPRAEPMAMVVKGEGGVQTYTIMCASAAPATVRTTLDQGLGSLKAMRASVATQPATAVFPEAERAHALAAIDRSIREVQETLAKLS